MSEEDKPKPPKPLKAHCSRCGGDRNCTLHGQYIERGGDENYDWSAAWRILQCMGCEYIFFQRASTDSESYFPVESFNGEYHYEYEYTFDYWPSLSKRKRPEWLDYQKRQSVIDEKLKDALDELYTALDNGLNILSAIAIRMAFDVASDLLGIKDGTFNNKLAELVKKGHIGEVDRGRIAILIDAGSASAHRGWKPKIDELDLMMDILEHFVHHAFVAPAERRISDEKAAKMRALVPERLRKSKTELLAAPPETDMDKQGPTIDD